MRITGTLLVVILSISSLFGQIAPPDLFCIEGDGTEIHIQWAAPISQCGPFSGYEVYYASQPQGPYQSFTINDPAVTDTFFAAGEPIYCYMESIMACPGQNPVPSDTLVWDLSPPQMQTVSVNGSNQIEVTWFPGGSPDISAYLIYVDGANIPDTVYGNSSTVFVDNFSDPNTSVHDYSLAWYRDCTDADGRRGTIGDEYRSILTENLFQDRCERSFRFSWTAYAAYSVNIDGYEIEVSENGGAYIPVDTIENTTQLFTYENAVTDVFYCFRVNALLSNGYKAMSNSICDTARVVDIPVGAHIRNATVINDDVVEIEYYPDTAGIVDLFRAQRSESGNNFQDWPVALIASTGVPEYEIYRDNNAVTQRRSYSYRFYREDECANAYVSDTVRTIHMNAKLGLGLKGDLQWNAYENSRGEVARYIIHKITNGDTSQLATVSAATLEYEDLNALNPNTLDTVCYFITAEVDLNIDDLVNETVYSMSNIRCLNPKPRIFAPKAFRPEGFNSIFIPIIQFGTGVNYNFRIWNRIGQKLFETNDVNLGWDGTYNNEIVPLDNYVYYVTFEGQDGNMYSKAGNVIVVR